MLQRQIMFKQLQELQRKQQLQELGNMQMLQHGGPNEPTLSQNHNFAPQFNMFSYDNLNQYSHLQVPSNHSLIQQHSFLSDFSAFNIEALSSNYSPQGFQKNVAFTESENGNENASSLDPLEQEILYNTDDSSWESAFSIVGKLSSESKVETPSLQSGSWSALMQSAVAESSSSDAGIQEEWSGLSFQNPEPFTDTEKLQSDWVDRNLHNNSSPSSKPEKLFVNIDSFANLQQPAQYIQHKEEYHLESLHATMQHSPRNMRQLVGNNSQQIFQGSLTLENIWPGEHKANSNNDACNPSVFSCANYIQPSENLSGREFGGSFWLRGSASGQVSSIQKNHDQVNRMNMAPVGVSTVESATAPSESVFELLNKDDTSNNQTPAKQLSSKVSIHRELPSDHPQSHSFSPSLSGNSSATSLHMEYVHPVSNHITTPHPLLQQSEFAMGHNPLCHEHKQPEKGNSAQELNLPFVLPSDATYVNLAFSVPKKRKLAVFDMIPWHKVNCERSRLQDISTAEYLWAEASNRKPVEAINEAEILQGLLPVNRAKRRLVSTTQLMQQVFGPQPVYILCSDAGPNSDCVAYFAARLALGDVWSLTSQLPSETNNVSPDNLKTSKRTKACEFSKVVEVFIDRVKKMESDLSGFDKSLSFLDIKIEARELEKVSTINRFAKFHIRPHPIKANPCTSYSTTAPLKNLQKYVVPVPMPNIVPQGQDCVSL